MVRGGHGRCQGWYPPGSIRRTRVSSGAGAGRRGGPWSAAAERGPGPACGDQSEAGRRTLQRGVTFRSNARSRGARAAPLSFAPSFIRFHGDLRDPSSSRMPLARELVSPELGRFPGPIPCCRPCPDAYVRRRRVTTSAVQEPRERQSFENSLTFHCSGFGKKTPRSSGTRLTSSATASYHTAHS